MVARADRGTTDPPADRDTVDTAESQLDAEPGRPHTGAETHSSGEAVDSGRILLVRTGESRSSCSDVPASAAPLAAASRDRLCTAIETGSYRSAGHTLNNGTGACGLLPSEPVDRPAIVSPHRRTVSSDRVAPPAIIPHRANWSCRPDICGECDRATGRGLLAGSGLFEFQAPAVARRKCRFPMLWSLMSSMSYSRYRQFASIGERADMGTVPEIALQVGDPEPPTERCGCGREHWRWHDTPDRNQPISCLKCGAHWWERDGEVVQGPAFVRFRRGPQPPHGSMQAATYFKNLNRFNYWQIPSLNPCAGTEPGLSVLGIESAPEEIDKIAHRALSRRHGRRHRTGDPSAIVDYVKADAFAFRSTWVVRQVEEWRNVGDVEALRQLVTAYASPKGRTPSAKLRQIILRDQRLFRDVIDRLETGGGPSTPPPSLETVLADVAEGHGVSEDSAKRVYQEYRRFYNANVPSRWTRAEFFEELAAMVARIPDRG